MSEDKKEMKSEAEETEKEEDIPEITVSEEDEDNDKTQEPESDDPDVLREELEAARQELKEKQDMLLRNAAEFENYKKRTARETENFKKFANESLIKEMLPVLDNLERAIEASNDEAVASGIAEGVEMTLKEILKILDKFGVRQIQAIGETFNPAVHEAVIQEESEEYPDNTVSKELQKGYILHDRLLRPSMVAVSKAKS